MHASVHAGETLLNSGSSCLFWFEFCPTQGIYACVCHLRMWLLVNGAIADIIMKDGGYTGVQLASDLLELVPLKETIERSMHGLNWRQDCRKDLAKAVRSSSFRGTPPSGTPERRTQSSEWLLFKLQVSALLGQSLKTHTFILLARVKIRLRPHPCFRCFLIRLTSQMPHRIQASSCNLWKHQTRSGWMCVLVEPRRHGRACLLCCSLWDGAVTELDVCHLVRLLGHWTLRIWLSPCHNA